MAMPFTLGLKSNTPYSKLLSKTQMSHLKKLEMQGKDGDDFGFNYSLSFWGFLWKDEKELACPQSCSTLS